LPAEGVDEALADRRKGKLAEGRGGGGDAEDQRPLFGWHRTPEGRHDDAERTDGNSDARHHAGGQGHDAGIRREGHAEHAEGVDGRTRRNRAAGADAVCEGAGEGLGNAPGQVLDGHGHAPAFACQAQVTGHRQREEAEAGADAIADRRDNAAGNDQHKQGDCGAEGGRGHGEHPKGGRSIYACDIITQSNIAEWRPSMPLMGLQG
jgi:hypothetical protein